MVAHTNRGSCRIIGGKWRGRKINFEDAEGLRPTTDRIRETVFNWLQPYIYQSHVLDAFAGSGILGFESLSRGADEVVFIEQNKKTIKRLKENISLLGAASAKVRHDDVIRWLRSNSIKNSLLKPFNIVFLDPPFNSDLLAQSCVLLNSSGCLAEDAIIYVEQAVESDILMPENWTCLKQKSAGQVSYKLYRR